MMAEVTKVAPWPVSVCLSGETGTGKTVIAKAIHDLSPRTKKPFIALNCATIGSDLFESELFGHEKGAFTGAFARKLGLMEQADGGTLFLDEIGELPLSVQAKLLKALEEKKFRRVGGDREIAADVRIISATNRDLERHIEAGQFRQDLRARLGSFRITVPSLSERRADVPALFDHYFAIYAPMFNRLLPYSLEQPALDVLINCAWPDNVRQLRAVAERLALETADTGIITAADALRVAQSLGAAPSQPRPASLSAPLLAPPSTSSPEGENSPGIINVPPYVVGETYANYEKRVLLTIHQELLERTGHLNRVCDTLKIPQRTFYSLLRRARKSDS
jgi:Nif-specific regulatory protein